MRIRSIKPEFWASESVGRLSRDTRLVFVGLWSLADDSGRFRADPRYIAGQLFPYDDDGLKTVSRALASLREEGCVHLYEADRSQYGQVTGWERHQKIDRPSPSKIPQPPETPLANIREDSTKPREASCEEQGTGNREGNREQGGEGKAAGPSAQEQLRQAWNDNRGPKLPEWRADSAHRDKPARDRLKERPIAEWVEVVKRIAASPFCTGSNDRGWRADPEFFLRAGTAAKVLEGKYDRGKGQAVDLSGDWRSRVNHEADFFEGVGS